MPLSEAEQLEILGRGGPGYQERITAAYVGYPSMQARLRLAGDMFFTSSVWRIAQAHQHFAPVYVYQFDYAPWPVRSPVWRDRTPPSCLRFSAIIGAPQARS